MALALPWILVYSSTTRFSRLSGIAICAVGVAACGWIAANQSMLGDQYGFIDNQFQLVVAICLLVVVIEAARRAIGWPLPLIAVLALMYGLLGQYIPGEFGHSGTPLNSFLGMLTIAEGGIWGSLTGISVGIVAMLVDGNLSLDWRRTLARFESVCISAGKQVSLIASIILCASIIIGVLAITGLGVKITSLILSGSGGLLWPSLFLTALACLVLGMEVPTTAAYVICVSVAGPALVQLGLEPLQAHLFVFWFALLSTITPPVCGAVFIAAGMVEENWLKVALTAMTFGVGLYLIPLGIIADPLILELLDQPTKRY